MYLAFAISMCCALVCFMHSNTLRFAVEFVFSKCFHYYHDVNVTAVLIYLFYCILERVVHIWNVSVIFIFRIRELRYYIWLQWYHSFPCPKKSVLCSENDIFDSEFLCSFFVNCGLFSLWMCPCVVFYCNYDFWPYCFLEKTRIYESFCQLMLTIDFLSYICISRTG